jgi:AraC family transcriptional regulator
MEHLISLHRNPDVSAIDAFPPERLVPRMPIVNFSPAEVVRHQRARWRGVEVETVDVIRHEHFEYNFQHHRHLLIAVEQGARYAGETFIEGLPPATLRNYSHKLVLVPAGRKFLGFQTPRLLTRSICVYIDPPAVPVDPELGFSEADLEPRLLFEDSSLWQTVLKLKSQIGSGDPGSRLYAEAIGGLLAHELLLLHRAKPTPRPTSRGGLAAWQQKRIVEFMEEHVEEGVSLSEMANLVQLSPYHFLRSFKQSFGEPPHRYWTGRRIERAKALLANPHASITQVALDVGFSGASAFGVTFHRITGQTPTDYRRSLE